MDASDILSVVITTYNRSDALLAVLDGLTRQTDQNFEVIVADDGSSLEHQQLIFESQSARTLRVIHVWHPDVGFTASSIRNRGVANSCGKYIIFLDGDCVPEVDFIARHKLLGQEGVFVNCSWRRVPLWTFPLVLAHAAFFGSRQQAEWLDQVA
jgi:glycosyltransferase involved in cell wall biosynthesis